jgi:hypothetical protein
LAEHKHSHTQLWQFCLRLIRRPLVEALPGSRPPSIVLQSRRAMCHHLTNRLALTAQKRPRATAADSGRSPSLSTHSGRLDRKKAITETARTGHKPRPLCLFAFGEREPGADDE